MSLTIPEAVTKPSRTLPQWEVNAQLDVSYSVSWHTDLLATDYLALVGGTSDSRRIVIVDDTVARIFGTRIQSYFEKNTSAFRIVELACGEEQKTVESVTTILEAIQDFGVSRRSEPVIAIGGGVLMDIVGFACSMFRRGTPYVRVPTTLVGIIDAGIGVKTGVNFLEGKNKIGSYFAPQECYIDTQFLETLAPRHISNGLGEVLKMALACDAHLFEMLSEHSTMLRAFNCVGGNDSNQIVAGHVLARSIHSMLVELEPNLWEHRLERAVDYGHTFSPTIEMAALPRLLHGEAVAIDMMITTKLSQNRGLVDPSDAARILDVTHMLGLPVWDSICTPGLLAVALREATTHRDGFQRVPLPCGIGDVIFANDIAQDELARALETLRDAVCEKVAHK